MTKKEKQKRKAIKRFERSFYKSHKTYYKAACIKQSRRRPRQLSKDFWFVKSLLAGKYRGGCYICPNYNGIHLSKSNKRGYKIKKFEWESRGEITND